MGRDRQRAARANGRGAGDKSGIARLRGAVVQPGSVGVQLGDYPRIYAAIDRVVQSGDAVIIGRTRDGGAICLTVLSGDDREKLYAATEEELGQVAEALFDAYGDAE